MTEEAEKTATHESYGAGWTKVSLMVNRKSGEVHCVGGEREGEGESDSPYIGAELLRKHWGLMLGKTPPPSS